MPRIEPSKAPRTVYHQGSGVSEKPMVETRETLDSLIAPPSRFTAGTTFPRAKEIHYAHLERLGLTEQDLLAYALVLGREEPAP